MLPGAYRTPLHRPSKFAAPLGAALCLLTMVSVVPAQAAGPGAVATPNNEALVDRLAAQGRWQLRCDDLLAARSSFRQLREMAPEMAEGLLGLGDVYLKLGRVQLALRYARAARSRMPSSGRAAALEVRALLRLRLFDEAVDASTRAVRELGASDAALMAAHASAMFRVQRTAEASDAYRAVLEIDPDNAEAHSRLGSGLIGPRAALIEEPLRRGVLAMRGGNFDGAMVSFKEMLRREPGHPIAHRLLGETLTLADSRRSLGVVAPEFRRLASALAVPELSPGALADFMPGFDALDPRRRDVAARAVATFKGYVPRLVKMGGRHDLLDELERTTAAKARAALRGKRTFDGRVWDDVRGMGGLRAATGIEALDDARSFGFNTLSHEVAHQAHLYGFRATDRRRVRALYKAAKAGGYCLDYYAANNEAEYFGQGVEAFVSLGKRPGREVTHGHTRFELYRVDRALHDFIASVVDHDPLGDLESRRRCLGPAAEVALVSGRPEDAAVAAGMMEPGSERDRLLALARRRVLLERSY